MGGGALVGVLVQGLLVNQRDPGQEITVQVAVPARALAHWDGGTHAWTIEPGRFRLAAGPSYGDERLAIEVATRS